MTAINSFSTEGQEEYEVVYVGTGRDLDFNDDVSG
jgi:hypothetical protein